MSVLGDIFNGVFNSGSGYYGNSNNSTNRSLSFPSATNRGKNRLKLMDDGSGDAQKAFPKQSVEAEKFTQNYINRIPSMNLNISEELKSGLLYDPSTIETDKFGKYNRQVGLPRDINHNLFENPWEIGGDVMRSMNWYRFKYKNQVRNVANIDKHGKAAVVHYSEASITPSLFNPKFGVLSKGLSWNVPLLIDASGQYAQDIDDVSDCSIANLVQLSHQGYLGAQRYRYTDFMYCKDLGKVANNHLITLRKFAFPVGDVIGSAVAPKFKAAIAQEPGYMAGDDIARMITWFDTDDNKLEDILNFQYEYTWKQLESKAQQLPSQENDSSRGAVGLFANLNADNYRHMQNGTSGPQNLWSKLLGGTFKSFNMESDPGQLEKFRNYDNNKVYTQKQAVQDMYIPEGKLKFSQEITLTFSYKLRAYDNINPKSAFLDLIGNILECTYFRGSFWGGSQSIIGPKPNNASYYKVNAFLDNAWDKIGGALSAMAAGTDDLGSLLGVLSSIAGEAINGITNAAKEKLGIDSKGEGEGKTSVSQNIARIMSGLWNNAGLGQATKAAVQNALGRPAFYAFDSLLTGEDTGLWHLTIGNPLNPIATMGNMIMKNASIQHFGPLGIDDFPTEIKVKVTLAHARSRDLQQIGKMYTQGLTALYQTTNRHEWKDFYPDTFGNVKSTITDADGNTTTIDETPTGSSLDSARNDAQKAHETDSNASAGDKTDALIYASNLQSIQMGEQRQKTPLIANDGVSGFAELTGSQTLITGVLDRDEYA